MAFEISGLVNLQLSVGATSRLRAEIRQALGSAMTVPINIRNQGQLFGISTQLTSVRAAAVAAGLGIGSLTGAVGSLGSALRSNVSDAIRFNREMVRLAQVSSEPAGVVRALGREVENLATSLGVGSSELARTAVTLKQSGLSIRETQIALSAIAKASLAPTFEGGSRAITEMAIAARQFGIDSSKLEGALGSVSAVSAAYAVESGDLAKAISKSGGAASTARVSFNELLGLMTAVRSTTRESADQIATGLRTIFARLQRADVVEQLEAVGVNLRRTRDEAVRLGNVDLEGQFVGGFEAIRRLSEATSNIPGTDPRFSEIITALGGYRQLSRVLPLLQQYKTALEAVSVAEAGKAILDVNATQAQDAIAIRLTKVREELLGVGRAAIESKGFSQFIDVLEKGADAGTRLVKALGPLVPILGGIAAYRLGSAGLAGLGVTGASLLARSRFEVGPGLGGAIGAYHRGSATLGIGAGIGAAAILPSLLESNSLTGGAITGATAGGLAGSVFGPLGAGVGAVVGALVGFREALNSTRESIQNARIEQELTLAGNLLTDVRAGENPAAVVALGKTLTELRSEVNQRARDESTNLLGRFNAREFASNLSRETKLVFGPRLIELTEAANTQAALLGRRNPNADAAALGQRFAGENAGLEVLGSLKGQSPADVLKPFIDLIRAAQSQRAAQGIQNRFEDNTVRVAASFVRLADAVERANTGLTSLGQRTAALSSLADGSGAARPAALDINNQQILARIVAPLGGAGGELLARSDAARRLRDVLPSALTELASGNPLEGAATGAKLRELLTAALGGKPTRQEGLGIDSVVDAVGRIESEDLFRQAVDPTALTDSLLKAFYAPINDASQRIAREYTEASSHLTDALNLSASRLRDIGEAEDRIADLRLAAIRARTAVRADVLGVGGSGPSLPEGLAPFYSRQRRLLAGTGLATEDVGGISGRLARTRAEILAATAERDNAVGTREGFTAAERLSRLSTEADRLQTALKNLADPMSRAAVLQERLNQLNADRDSRLGFAERFLLAGPDERGRLTRGQSLAAALNKQPGLFDRLSGDDQRLSIEAARLIGSARFANGRTGEGLRTTLLARTGVLSQADERERTGLLGEQGRIAGQAADAQQALAEYQRETQTQFVASLRDSQESFFSRLSSLLLGGRLAEARVGAGAAAESLRGVRERVALRDSVRAFGVQFGSQEDADRLRAYRPELGEYVSGVADLNRFRQDRRALIANTDFAADFAAQGGVYGNAGTGHIEGAISRSLILRGVDADTAAAVGPAAKAKFEELVTGRGLDRFSRDKSGQVGAAFNEATRSSLAFATAEAVARRSGPLSLQGGRLTRGLPGLNLDAVTPDSLNKLDRALETFGKAGSGLDTLDKRAKDAATAFEAATSAVKDLESSMRGKPSLPGAAALVGGAIFRAAGGPVPNGGPRGTDVVGAWLTPGEHVVNAASAAANRGLLHRINAARGPLYLAAGGFVGPPSRRQLLEQEIAAAQAANTAARIRQDGRELALRLADPYGTYALDNASLGRLARANAGSQTRSLLLQQAYGGIGEEQYDAAVGRLAGTESRDAKRFAQKFGGRFVDYGDRLRQQEAARRYTSASLSRSADYSIRVPGLFERNVRSRFADGGLVPGWSTTDTVPAALQRGEFVLTREAVRDIGVSRLNDINKRSRFADGGLVGGGASGSSGGAFGLSNEAAAAMQAFASQAEQLSRALNGFGSPAQALAGAFGTFGSSAEKLVGALEKIPQSIDCAGRFDIQVNHNGAEVMESMKGELARLIDQKVSEALRAEFSARQPEQPAPLRSNPTRL